MLIRAYQTDDRERVVALAVETFQPFFEDSFPAMVNHDEELVRHQHGQWRDDQARDVDRAHAPEESREAAVAEADGQLLGYVAWSVSGRPGHGYVDTLAVSPAARRRGVGEALMAHAMQRLRDNGCTVVELGTGGDDFHAPARALYERLGFHPIPVTVYLRRL